MIDGRALAAAAPIVAALAACGCGGGGGGATDASSTATGADTTAAGAGHASTSPPPPAEPSRAQAVAFVRAVGLRPADFPYFKSKPHDPETAQDRRSRARLAHCIGVANRGLLVKRDSRRFEATVGATFAELGSEVEVFSLSSFVARQLRAVRRRGRRCIGKLVPSQLAEAGSAEVDVRSVRTSRLPSPAPSIESSFGYRIRVRVALIPGAEQLAAYDPAAHPQQQVTDVYVDLVGFTVGPAEIELTATGAPQPVSRTLERRVLLLLDQRAREFDWGE